MAFVRQLFLGGNSSDFFSLQKMRCLFMPKALAVGQSEGWQVNHWCSILSSLRKYPWFCSAWFTSQAILIFLWATKTQKEHFRGESGKFSLVKNTRKKDRIFLEASALTLEAPPVLHRYPVPKVPTESEFSLDFKDPRHDPPRKLKDSAKNSWYQQCRTSYLLFKNLNAKIWP